MRQRLLVAVLVTAPLLTAPLLAACGAQSPPPTPAAPPPATATSSTTAAPRPAGETATGADGDDLAACLDGSCEVTVRSGTEIRVAPEFEIDRVVVDGINGRRARITIEPTDGGVITASGSGPRSSYNDLTVRIERVVGDTAVVSLESS